jgi:hypothetical protein
MLTALAAGIVIGLVAQRVPLFIRRVREDGWADALDNPADVARRKEMLRRWREPYRTHHVLLRLENDGPVWLDIASGADKVLYRVEHFGGVWEFKEARHHDMAAQFQATEARDLAKVLGGSAISVMAR